MKAKIQKTANATEETSAPSSTSVEDTANLEAFVPEQTGINNDLLKVNQQIDEIVETVEAISEEDSKDGGSVSSKVQTASEGGEQPGLTTVPFYKDDEFEPHPIRQNDPVMDEFQQLAIGFDISEKGQYKPITLFPDKDDGNKLKILDGRSEYTGCKEFRITPRYVIFNGTIEEALKYVISNNIHRTLYSKSALSCFAAEDKKNVKETNKKLFSEKMKGISSGKKNFDKISTNEFLEIKWGVGKSYINRAEKIMKTHYEIFLEMKKNLLELPDAEKKIATQINSPKHGTGSGKPQGNKVESPQLNLYQEAKVSELIGCGIKKPAAIERAVELVREMEGTLSALNESPKRIIQISLSEKVIDFIEKKSKDDGYSLSQMFEAWLVESFHIEL